MLDSDTLKIVLGAGVLPDETRYTINLSGALQSSDGEALGGDVECMVRALIADANGSGVVNITDQLAVKSKIGASIQDWPQYDLNTSGSINVSDQLLAKSRITTPSKTALCP